MATAGDTLKVAGLVSITPSFANCPLTALSARPRSGVEGSRGTKDPTRGPVVAPDWCSQPSRRGGRTQPALARYRGGSCPAAHKGAQHTPFDGSQRYSPAHRRGSEPRRTRTPINQQRIWLFGRDGSAQACLPYNPDSVRLAGAVVAAAGHSPRASQVRRPPPQARRRDAGPPPPSYRSRRHATPEGRGRRHDAGDVTQVGNHHPVGGQAVPRVAHCQHGRTSKGRQLPRVGPAGTPVRPSARVGPPMDDARPGAAPRSPVTRLADPPSGRRRGKQRRRLWSAPPAALFLGTTHPRAASRRLRCATRHDTRRRRGCRRHQLGETQLPNGE